MEITKLEIQKNNKDRVNLYLDEKYYSGISLELVVREHLKVGLDIDEEYLRNLILEDEKGKALAKAIKYIGTNLKTAKQLRDYLRKKDYNPNTINYVMDKLIEYNYLDDENYARAYVLTYSTKYGKLKLKSQLKSKGVSDEIIDKYLDTANIDSIEKVALKYMKNKEFTYENCQKLSRFLYSRGYEFDEINSLVNRLKEEKD